MELFQRYNISPERNVNLKGFESTDIVDIYAEIDSHFQLRGRKLGKNDLWSAASTVSLGATLLTTDRDFDKLDPLFLKRDWVSPVG